MGTVFHLRDFRSRAGVSRREGKTTFFARGELESILACYSRFVARGLWRDYAIDHQPGFAVFSIFSRSHEAPLFAIVKTTGGRAGPGEFQVFRGGAPLVRTPQLAKALYEIERKAD